MTVSRYPVTTSAVPPGPDSPTPIDLDKLRSVGAISRRSGPVVREARTDAGRIKATTDELGNTVTEHSKGDRQDVLIRAQAVEARLT